MRECVFLYVSWGESAYMRECMKMIEREGQLVCELHEGKSVYV